MSERTCPVASVAVTEDQAAADAILQQRGNGPRICQNTLVFLAVDQTRLQDLDEAVRRYLAWSSILGEKEELNLDPHQVRQAETQCKAAEGAVVARLPEAYQWLLVPVQETPQAPVAWQAFRLSGQDHLAVRASKRLRSEELFVPSFAGTRLQMELNRIPLWRDDHVGVRQLMEDFSRYLYLPRLRAPDTQPPPNAKPGRYYGRVALDATRVGRDAGQIADEVISHLAGLVGSSVTVTLEIEADVPDGVPDNVVRTVTENSRTLKFTAHGFEKE